MLPPTLPPEHEARGGSHRKVTAEGKLCGERSCFVHKAEVPMKRLTLDWNTGRGLFLEMTPVPGFKLDLSEDRAVSRD